MKAKYILIVVVAVLLPAVSNARTYGLSVPAKHHTGPVLNTQAQGYYPAQTTADVDFSDANRTSSNAVRGIATQNYMVHSSSVGTVAYPAVASVGTSYSTEAPIQSVSIMMPKIWKGKVSHVGATFPIADSPTKRRNSGFPDDNPEPMPDPPAGPVGDIPWWVLLLLVAGYGVWKVRRATPVGDLR